MTANKYGGPQGTIKDPKTDAKVAIDYAHHEVHEGDAFTAEVTNTNMGDNERIQLAFVTPAASSKRIHMTVDFHGLAKGHMDITEGTSWTNETGTEVTPLNKFRDSTTTSTLLGGTITNRVMSGVIGMTGGTTICPVYIFAEKKTGGATNRGRAELILKESTNYVIAYEADAASNAGQLILNWYEHADTN